MYVRNAALASGCIPGEGYQNVQVPSDSGGLAFKVRLTIGSLWATCWVNSQSLGQRSLEMVFFS